MRPLYLLLVLAAAVPFAPQGVAAPSASHTFSQQVHTPFPLATDSENDVRAITVDAAGKVWVASGAGVFVLDEPSKQWSQALPQAEQGPAFCIVASSAGNVYAGAWNVAYQSKGSTIQRCSGFDGPVSAIAEAEGELWLFGPGGIWKKRGSTFERQDYTIPRSVRAAILAPDNTPWVATGQGLADLSRGRLYRDEAAILSSSVFDLTFTRTGQLWAGGLGGVTVYEGGERVGEFTTANGLPSIYVQAVEVAPQGHVWVGTTQGIAIYNGQDWAVRHSRRWLLHDEVRDIAFDGEGTAWVATAGGVSAIATYPMTYQEKEAYFQHLAETRHTRPPGFVEKVELKTAGDYESWEPEDDDNDGEYTSMYLIAQAYRYAATGDAAAKAQAAKAFAALKFLQTVTGTEGFVARTVIPPDWTEMHDPNRTYTAQERAESLVQDPRYKPVEMRWRLSEDKQWLWKGDTSSDEITGHFCGYGYYYDLVADDQEKAVVREHTRRIMDYIIDGGYVLRDIDGTHTRWGVWAPERLKQDPDWAAEAGINAAEILSYLKTTYHMTADEKYQKEYLRLLNEEGYRDLVKRAKTFAPAWRTHIDDELLALTWPGLLKYEKDPELRALYKESMDTWYNALVDNKSPYFNLLYAELSGEPDKHLEDSLAFLRDAPLDLINWTVDNSKREDVKLVRNPNIEPLQTEEVLPPSERGVVRWDKNPFEAVQGDGGRTAWAPTFWLLSYWQARHLGALTE